MQAVFTDIIDKYQNESIWITRTQSGGGPRTRKYTGIIGVPLKRRYMYTTHSTTSSHSTIANISHSHQSIYHLKRIEFDQEQQQKSNNNLIDCWSNK